jgi:hypothetical protein
MTLTDTARNAACNAIVDLLDSGTAKFETSADVEVATCTFGATAFGAAASGVATANAITADSSATGGVIEHLSLYTSGATKLAELTCGVGSGECQCSNLTIGAGDTVSITAMTITVPAS